MTSERSQAQARFEKIKRIARKSALPAAISAAVLFPTAVYTDTAINEDVTRISDHLSDLSDNSTAQKLEAVAFVTGIAMTANANASAKRWDEKKLHILRVAGPSLLSAASASAFIDSQITLNYAIPAGLAYASTIAIGATNIRSTFERTRDMNIRSTTVAVNAAFMVSGAAIFLAAADKL